MIISLISDRVDQDRYTTDCGINYFPMVFGEFNKLYPNVGIELFEYGSKKIEQALAEGALDVGVVCSRPARPELFEVCYCIKDPIRLIVHSGHPLASKKTVTFEQLAGEPFVLYREDFSLHDHILGR